MGQKSKEKILYGELLDKLKIFGDFNDNLKSMNIIEFAMFYNEISMNIKNDNLFYNLLNN